ncbi:hypothetical protein N2152v2_008170 [Parachlorella kessleri]
MRRPSKVAKLANKCYLDGDLETVRQSARQQTADNETAYTVADAMRCCEAGQKRTNVEGGFFLGALHNPGWQGGRYRGGYFHLPSSAKEMELLESCVRLLAKSESGRALVDAMQEYIDEHNLDPETGVAVDIYNAVIVTPPKKFRHHNRKLDIRVDNRSIVVLRQNAGL